jgi:hypothetical protein
LPSASLGEPGQFPTVTPGAKNGKFGRCPVLR